MPVYNPNVASSNPRFPKGYFVDGPGAPAADNPFYGSRDESVYSRFNENAGRGVGIPGIRTYADARRAYETYQALKPGQKGYENAQRFNKTLNDVYGVGNWKQASDEQLFNALDDTFRGYQEDNKKEPFNIGGLLGQFVGPAVGFATGQPWLAAAAGGLGGGLTGGVRGAITGGLGGYAAGNSNLFGSDGFLGYGNAAGNQTGTLQNFATGNGFNVGPLSGSANIGTAGTFSSGGPTSGFFGSPVGGGASGSGGGGVGFFDNFTSGLGGIAADLAGDAIGGFIGGYGSDKAANQFEQAAQNAQQVINPAPFQGNSLFLNSNARGQASLSPFGRAQLGQVSQLQGQAYKDANFNRNAFRDRLLEASNRVNDKREGQAFSSLESKLFNRQGASTGTQRQIADFKSDIEDRRFNRATQAEIVADQFKRERLGDYAGLYDIAGNIDDRFRSLQGLNVQGGDALSPYAINNPAAGVAGAFRANTTTSFFDSLGAKVGGAVTAGLSSAFNPLSSSGGGASGGGGGGFYNPSAINFGANPFTRSYEGLG